MSQYSVFRALSGKRRTMWHIPSGKGKSRVIITIALLFLVKDPAAKIHFLFDCKQLMERDQKTFALYWENYDYKYRVEFHYKLDFKVNNGDILLIDEADVFMFK